jgi:spore coat protein U-like protein
LTQRLLTDASGDTLQYNLFKDAAFTTIFGDGTVGTQTVGGTGQGMAIASAQSVTVYGSLPDNANNQAQPAGSYSDLITVTVSY